MDGGAAATSLKQNQAVNGLSVSSIDDATRYRYKLPSDMGGVLVTDVKDGSDAQKFGFETGDIIIQVAEDTIKNIAEFNKAIANAKGKKTLVWVNRKGVIQGLVIK